MYMDTIQNYIFYYLKYAKIIELLIIRNYSGSGLYYSSREEKRRAAENSYIRYRDSEGNQHGSWGGDGRISSALVKQIDKLIEHYFDEIYKTVNTDLDEYWELRVDISVPLKTISIDASHKVLKEQKEVKLEKNIFNLDSDLRKNILGLQNYYGNYFKLLFDGMWDESDIDFYDNYRFYRLKDPYLTRAYEVVNLTMDFFVGSFWNESQGAYGEIIVWGDDMFLSYIIREEEWENTGYKKVLSINSKSNFINENEDSEKSYELTKDQEIAFQKLLVLIKRKFPFIMDLTFNGHGNYFGLKTLEVNLTVDLEKVKDYYKTDFSETYYKNPYLFETLNNKDFMSFLFTPFKMEDKDELIGFNDKFDFYINKLVNALPTRLRTPYIKINKFTFKLDTSKYYNAREYFFQNHGFYPS